MLTNCVSIYAYQLCERVIAHIERRERLHHTDLKWKHCELVFLEGVKQKKISIKYKSTGIRVACNLLKNELIN